MNHHCYGTEFDRWGKHWAWCCMDGTIYETKPFPECCGHCGRQWRMIRGDKEELDRIKDSIERQVDFPYYKVRTAELEAAMKDLRVAAQEALIGLNQLAQRDAKRDGTTFDMTDYTFAKRLRAVLKSSDL
jgi:hypothetical protein